MKTAVTAAETIKNKQKVTNKIYLNDKQNILTVYPIKLNKTEKNYYLI